MRHGLRRHRLRPVCAILSRRPRPVSGMCPADIANCVRQVQRVCLSALIVRSIDHSGARSIDRSGAHSGDHSGDRFCRPLHCLLPWTRGYPAVPSHRLPRTEGPHACSHSPICSPLARRALAPLLLGLASACGGESATTTLQPAYRRRLAVEHWHDERRSHRRPDPVCPAARRSCAGLRSQPRPSDSYRVVGRLSPPSWSWGEIEPLKAASASAARATNRRTEKLRERDTFQSDKYPLRVYFGALNQQIVDGFLTCTTATPAVAAPAPARPPPLARPVPRPASSSCTGPKTAAGSCRSDLSPMLLVHGAMRDGNVWLFPGGNDGTGAAFPGTTQKTGLVQYLEAAGRCVYAVTFGNFHGDNYSHAIGVANAVARIRALHSARTAACRESTSPPGAGACSPSTPTRQRRQLADERQPLLRSSRAAQAPRSPPIATTSVSTPRCPVRTAASTSTSATPSTP